jgi:hypothetical protein
MSVDCQHYKEQDKERQNLVSEYTEQNKATRIPSYIHDGNEYPSLPHIVANQISLDSLIQMLYNTLGKVIEEKMTRLLQSMSRNIGEM